MKFKPTENERKYGFALAAIIVLAVIGLYLVFVNTQKLIENYAIGIALLVIAGFIGFLLFRSTKKK